MVSIEPGARSVGGRPTVMWKSDAPRSFISFRKRSIFCMDSIAVQGSNQEPGADREHDRSDDDFSGVAPRIGRRLAAVLSEVVAGGVQILVDVHLGDRRLEVVDHVVVDAQSAKELFEAAIHAAAVQRLPAMRTTARARSLCSHATPRSRAGVRRGGRSWSHVTCRRVHFLVSSYCSAALIPCFRCPFLSPPSPVSPPPCAR